MGSYKIIIIILVIFFGVSTAWFVTIYDFPYKNIINLVKTHLPIVDFSEVDKKTKKFCVLRHDIEFSIDRAYELAKIEKELGVISTYTVQIRNNTYNCNNFRSCSTLSSRTYCLEPIY